MTVDILHRQKCYRIGQNFGGWPNPMRADSALPAAKCDCTGISRRGRKRLEGPVSYISTMRTDIEQLGINVIRGLAMDAPQAANSGHPGTAMALAPLAHVLWTRVMRYDASAPDWPDRDRFVLSAGHACILQYAMLYLTGYGLEPKFGPARIGDVYRIGLDNTRAHDELGWEPQIPLEEGLALTVDYFREQVPRPRA